MERLEQGKAPNITDEQAASRSRRIDGLVQDTQQIRGIGEVLDHRVDDDGVERACIDPRKLIGVGLLKAHLRKRAFRQFAFDAGECSRREIDTDVSLAFGSNAKKQQSSAAADFENAARAQKNDALGRALDPLPHLVGANWLARVAAIPPGDVESGVRRLLSVGFDLLLYVWTQIARQADAPSSRSSAWSASLATTYATSR